MLKCHIESHSTYQVLKQLGFDYTGCKALWLGAHDLLEKDILDHLGFAHTYCIECNPFVFPDLLERIGDDKRYTAIEACVWSEDDLEKTYHFYRNIKDGAGGLFNDKKMKDYIKDCPQLDQNITLKTKTVATIAKEKNIDLSSIDFLCCDLQGSELAAFKGSGSELRPKLIYCEVSFDEIYENGPLSQEIDNFLEEWGYTYIGTRMDWLKHGDSVYVRN